MNIYNTFAIADTHFAHVNICAIRKRHAIGGFAFESADAMDEMLIDNWNSVVGPKDHVIVVGDFCWKPAKFDAIFDALHGTKYFAVGNHDGGVSVKSPKWAKIDTILHFKLGQDSSAPRKDRIEFFCCHYPMRSWNKSTHGSFLLYGHTHMCDMRDRREFNVGADNPIDPWKPRRLDRLLAAMLPRWFPKRGGEPLKDDDPSLPGLFRDHYEEPLDYNLVLEELRERQERLASEPLSETFIASEPFRPV